VARGKLEVPEDGVAYIVVAYTTHLEAIERLLYPRGLELIRLPAELGGVIEGEPNAVVYGLGLTDEAVARESASPSPHTSDRTDLPAERSSDSDASESTSTRPQDTADPS
jgi:hypothetical protein